MNLAEFIESNPSPRELKRALAVQMREEGWKHKQIQSILQVQSSFISRWEQKYREEGVEGLRWGYIGSSGLLSREQREEAIEWLQEKQQIDLWEVVEYVERQYGVTYSSSQSYYDLLKAGGMSWHQGEKKIPNKIQSWWQQQMPRLPHG
jgi:putative transposase